MGGGGDRGQPSMRRGCGCVKDSSFPFSKKEHLEDLTCEPENLLHITQGAPSEIHTLYVHYKGFHPSKVTDLTGNRMEEIPINIQYHWRHFFFSFCNYFMIKMQSF